MNDAGGVRLREGVGHLREHEEQLIAREHPVLQRRGQAAPLEELHHHVEVPGGELPEVGRLGDVRALHRVGRLGFADEASEHVFGALHARLQDLHRQALAHDDVSAGVDHAHAASADDALDLVAAVDDLPAEVFHLTRLRPGLERDECDPVVGAAVLGVAEGPRTDPGRSSPEDDAPSRAPSENFRVLAGCLAHSNGPSARPWMNCWTISSGAAWKSLG